jgi:thioredoxin-related protein/tetratricopeptide (TPR) repeat protein
MKKHHLTFALFLFLALSSRGQANFLPISFNDALKQSTQNGQMIFLQVESEECTRCNEVADKCLSDKTIGDLLNQTFICLKIEADHPDRNAIKELYNVKGFGSFIIDQNKTLVHAYRGSTTNTKDFLKQVDMALTKAGEDIRLNELQKQYAVNKNPDLLEMLLLKKRSLNFETDSLLDEYVSILSPDSAKSERVLVFIGKMAPVLGSKADVVLRKDQMQFNKAWYTMDLNTRVATNNRIIHKSVMKAVKQKNEQFAYRVANFAKGSHTNQNSEAARKAFESNMLVYYKETSDTINYLIRAVYYYDNYYMHISPDSVKKRDSIRKRVLMAQADPVKTRTDNSNAIKVTKTIRFAPAGQFLARDINEGAWTVYKMTNDPLYLQKALQWSRKAIELWPSPEALDTWSRLLYKTGKKTEAITKQEEAITLQKKQGFISKEYETTLAKMKKGEVL